MTTHGILWVHFKRVMVVVVVVMVVVAVDGHQQ